MAKKQRSEYCWTTCTTRNEEKKQKMTIFFILVIFLVKTFLMVMVLKICLFINEHLVRWIWRKTKALIPWKSKRLFKSRFNPLCNAFFRNVKLFELRMEIIFNSTTLALEQKLCNQNSKLLHCLWFRLLAKKSALQFCIKRLFVWCH